MPTPRIFVSHSSHDSVFTRQLVADLRLQLGDETVWMDEMDGLHASEAWVDKIVAEITDREIFLLVLSPDALPPNSKWVPFEMGIALRQHVEDGKILIPLQLRPCPKPEAWKGVQHIDFTGQPATYATKLADLLAVIRATPGSGMSGERHSPTGSRDARVVGLIQDINTATGRERWHDVVEKTALLQRYYPGALTADLWRRRGRALLAQGELQPALEALEQALDPTKGVVGADPLDAPTLRFKGQTLGQLGQVDAAVAALEEARIAARDDELALKLEALADEYALLAAARQWAKALAVTGVALRLVQEDASWQQRRTQATGALEAERQAALRRQEAERQEAARRAAEQQRLAQGWAALERALGVTLPVRLKSDEMHFTPLITRAGQAVLVPPTVEVAAGPFWMGTQGNTGNEPWHQVTLGTYRIGVYPVTVAEYACAVKDGAVREPPKEASYEKTWQQQLQQLNHPVVQVNWRDAVKFVQWLCQVTEDQSWRLPTEAEWEKAARWDARANHARIYPWGDQWDKTKANTSDGGPKTTTPVGQYASSGDGSPYACHDMAGNVWEWCSSLYFAEAYQSDNKRENTNDHTNNRVLRGGSWRSGPVNSRAAYRNSNHPDDLFDLRGFRLLRAGAGLAG